MTDKSLKDELLNKVNGGTFDPTKNIQHDPTPLNQFVVGEEVVVYHGGGHFVCCGTITSPLYIQEQGSKRDRETIDIKYRKEYGISNDTNLCFCTGLGEARVLVDEFSANKVYKVIKYGQ